MLVAAAAKLSRLGVVRRKVSSLFASLNPTHDGAQVITSHI